MAEAHNDALKRWNKLELLQKHYRSFNDLLDDVMGFLNFTCTETQEDIGSFLQYGPQYLMVQAQRGQAKTTITAIYALFEIIHNPAARVLIVSAGGKTASDIATLIIRLIMNMEILECLRPDASAGDRVSVEGFDVHHSLKGVEKSASIACIGISGTLTSRRADLLIADDIESPKNSTSATERLKLLQLSREFSDVCSEGRIVYLGTPQSIDSVYNTLPSRGFKVQIWPGRYPTPEQMVNYGDHLAPMILKKIKADPSLQTGGGVMHDQGQPTDPRLDEAFQQQKELDKTTADYQLQYMLNTTLSDKDRYPLKTINLIALKNPGTNFPMTITKDPRESGYRDYSVHATSFKMASVIDVGDQFAPLQEKVMYIDPAGGGKNGDETAYAVCGFLNGNIYVLEIGGIPGGYDINQMEHLARVAKRNLINRCIIEKNFGYGAFKEVFVPHLNKEHKCGIEEDYVHGQKEKRIAEILGPIMGRGSLVVLEECVDQDTTTTTRYGGQERQLYSLFFQLSKVTLSPGALIHDDRLDALAGACGHFVSHMAIDQQKVIERNRAKEYEKWTKNPLGYNLGKEPVKSGSVFNKYRKH